MCRWFDSAPGHHYSRATVLGCPFLFRRPPTSRGCEADLRALGSLQRDHHFWPICAISILFCSLFSKKGQNPGSACQADTCGGVPIRLDVRHQDSAQLLGTPLLRTFSVHSHTPQKVHFRYSACRNKFLANYQFRSGELILFQRTYKPSTRGSD